MDVENAKAYLLLLVEYRTFILVAFVSGNLSLERISIIAISDSRLIRNA
jgi:hypothetical protein